MDMTFENVPGFTLNLHPSEKYLCSVCKSYILMPPVFLNPKHGFICGYCHQYKRFFLNKDEMLLPQELYEDLALSMRFPCEFCEYFVVFNGLAATHEVQCSKRIFRCPLSDVNRWFLGPEKPCDWQDNDGKSMVAHVKEKHKEFILQSPFEIRLRDLNCGEKQIYIAILNNRKIISIMVEDDEERNCIILRCRSNKVGHPELNHQCRIEIISPNSPKIFNYETNVYPLGAKIIERGRDTCTLWMGEFDEDGVLRLNFAPSLLERGRPRKSLPQNIDYNKQPYHDHCY
ncbi:uncharacterized protein LOC123321364 [Coccinella septempunctata]|uniref:uncharacterized protein LOC123321364 n=1 Tax=Coccinella septempunctata TaxID=41139 RepID=UPI001D05F1B9|nr:uncharacterized protein LOC123321364 [Coccinella septempunctata]